MDHNSFETHMIDFVNRNAQAEEDVRNKIARDEREAIGHIRRRKTTIAVIEYLLWIVALICVVMAMSFAYHLHFTPAEGAILASSLFAFVAGVRINTLAIRISRYGGRT